MYYVYILQSERDRKLYIGQTNNVSNRLERHNAGYVSVTRLRRPFKLLSYKEYDSRSEAMKIERYLKSLKGGSQFRKVLQQWGVAKW